jgi:hypothetical protein
MKRERQGRGAPTNRDGRSRLTLICLIKVERGVYQRTMTAPATIRPRKSGTNIGATNHSRRSNFPMSDTATALFLAGAQDSPSPIAANMNGDDRSRGSFRHYVEGNLEKTVGKPEVTSTQVRGTRSVIPRDTFVREISAASISEG